MFDIGFSELVLVAVIALLVLGPERLPTAARTAGRWVGSARRLVSQINQEVEKQIKLDELREKLRQENDHLSAEQVQKTVDEALQEARKFKHLVDQDIAPPADRPASPPTSPSPPKEAALEPVSGEPALNPVQASQDSSRQS